MKLSKKDLNYLRKILAAHGKRQTYWKLIKANAKRLLICFVYFGVMITLSSIFLDAVATALFCGVAIGIFFSLVGQFRHAMRFWPLTQEIIDREKVNTLVKDAEVKV
jgi:hypothetical protein